MGEVFVARGRSAERPVVALKRLRGDVARVPTFAERFEHEAQLAVRLSHPNVVATIDVGTVGAQLYVASELVLGKDTGVIADRLRERGQGAPVAVVIRILLDVLGGLAYVHSARERDGRWLALVHRDVTPGNVLVSYEGVARLADFGLAKSQLTDNSNLTNHGEILGTPHYLSPELVRGAKASSSSDLYGLGAVTYRILTGVAPFTGTTTEVLLKVLNERPRPISEWRPDLPAWFAGFVHQLLEPDPKLRPFDAALLARRLEHDAEEARLLLPHGSVGRWLSALFEEERAAELSEHEAIAALPLPGQGEQTRVYAAVEAGRGLEGGPAVTLGDDAGTELELPSEVLADLSREARRARFVDDKTVGRDPADARLPPWAETSADDGTPAGLSTSRSTPELDENTAEERGSLPGFADRRSGAVVPSRTSQAEELRTAVTDMELKKLSRGDAPDDKTAIRTVASSPSLGPRREDGGAGDATGPRPPDGIEDTHPPGAKLERGRPKPERGVDASERPTDRTADRASRPHEARPNPRAQVTQPLAPRPVAPPAAWSSKRVLGLAAVFALVGLGAAFVAVSARPSTPAAEASTVARFSALRAKIAEAAERGEAIEPRAVKLVTDAADALIAHDLPRAEQKLDELERALAAPRVVAP